VPLSTYGMLIGRITGSRPQAGGHPHWLLMVQPSLTGHPAYRVAVNLESSEVGAPPEVEYQAIDVDKDGSPALQNLVKALRKTGATNSFLTGPEVPALDFVRGKLIDPGAFQAVAKGQSPVKSAFQAALAAAAAEDAKDKALVAVFGTGYPVKPGGASSPATGYTGVDNIHMNQGSPNRTGAQAYYRENGANQDGGLIFLLPNSATALFVKFQSQSVETDANGNPLKTGIAEIDAKTPAVRTLLKADKGVGKMLKAAKAEAAAPLPGQAPGGFVFADPGPDDITGQFLPDDDKGASQTPFVLQYAHGVTRGPVPNPKRNPIMALTDVVGPQPPGYSRAANGDETIAFDLIGDSGAATEAKLKGETSVGDLMTAGAKASPPAFCFHVGDVVYFYGEKAYYYGQFADVFKDYPAPIFAIPGNHDGIIYDSSMISLDSFQQAFCADAPGRWDGFGGILRSTMTQPGVFFTLDAPLVSIIGLYSNCGESLGWLDDQQYAFLHNELTRLKAERAANGRAVILAVHHFPRWFPGTSVKDQMSAKLDAICTDVGFWPDAVVCGHAHLFQRIVRQTVPGRDIPYFVKPYTTNLAAKLHAVFFEEGFMRATVTRTAGGGTLSLEYRGVKHAGSNPIDTCAIDLAANKLA
jgi:uncharacterized protein YukJ